MTMAHQYKENDEVWYKGEKVIFQKYDTSNPKLFWYIDSGEPMANVFVCYGNLSNLSPYPTVKEEGGWISVQDRKPDNRSWVLAWHTKFNQVIYTCYKHGQWLDNGDYPDAYSDKYITHWMPLPEPPAAYLLK